MRLVIAAVVIAVSLSVSGCVSIAEHARPERLPIVDLHTHLNGDMEARHLLALMDRVGVRTMVLMARYYANPKEAGYGSDMQAADLARTHKGRFSETLRSTGAPNHAVRRVEGSRGSPSGG